MRPYKWVIKTNVDGSEQTPLNMKSGIKFPISLNAAQDDQDFFLGGGFGCAQLFVQEIQNNCIQTLLSFVQQKTLK